MLTFTITVTEENPEQEGPARKIRLKGGVQGHGTQAEIEYMEHFKPMIERMFGQPFIDCTDKPQKQN